MWFGRSAKKRLSLCCQVSNSCQSQLEIVPQMGLFSNIFCVLNVNPCSRFDDMPVTHMDDPATHCRGFGVVRDHDNRLVEP
jgi:hypothetical protein